MLLFQLWLNVPVYYWEVSSMHVGSKDRQTDAHADSLHYSQPSHEHTNNSINGPRIRFVLFT